MAYLDVPIVKKVDIQKVNRKRKTIENQYMQSINNMFNVNKKRENK